MKWGMRCYWRDRQLSPARLREKQGGKQRKFSPEEEREFYKLLQEEIEQGIVVEVPNWYPAYTSPVHIVPKKDGWRKVWDGRMVNAEQVDIRFRMEGPETVQCLMQRGDWATSINLKSAFNHVWVSKEMQPFLCFRYGGKSYKYVGMPFGSKHAPRLFTEALGYAVRFIRANWDIRMVAHMDDLLFLHQNRAKCELYTMQMAAYLRSLGWTLSIKKCSFSPTQ
jgi:hypothetical protein